MNSVHKKALRALLWGDPRHAQIAVLSGLALWGHFARELPLLNVQAVVIIATALAVEMAGVRFLTRPRRAFCPRSPLISALSLVLLLRCTSLWIAALAAVLAIGGKFVLRRGGRGGKHIFNPTNFALVLLLLLGGNHVWISPGQWGGAALGAAALVAAACWVLPRARGDATLAFIAFWAALLFARAFWLGEPFAIPLHQLQNGALLIFAGFMISDPRTLPDSRAGRIVFAALVASAAYILRFHFYETDALLYALFGAALFAPLLDAALPGARFHWPAFTNPTPTQRAAARKWWRRFQ